MKRILSALGILVLTGCLGGFEPVPDRKYGFFLIEAVENGEQYATQPFGIFYSSQPLDLPGLAPREFCFESLVDSSEAVFNPNLNHLDAGNAIQLGLSGSQTALVLAVRNGAQVYQAPEFIAYTPGDTALIEAPGGSDVAAFSARLKTAEAFTMETVGLPAVGADLPLVWTAAESPGSKMIVSLRWQGAGTGTSTVQLYCDMADDGSFAVPSLQLSGWRSATSRQVVATRERVVAPAAPDVTLRLISLFERAVPVAQ